MADIFPSTATTNDTLTLGHTIYKYDGEKWNKLSTPAGFGDMLKGVYDSNDNGVVDNSERLENRSLSQVIADSVSASALQFASLANFGALEDIVSGHTVSIGGLELTKLDKSEFDSTLRVSSASILNLADIVSSATAWVEGQQYSLARLPSGYFQFEETVGGGSGGHIVIVNGVEAPQRSKLEFVGAGITFTDDPINDVTIITIVGGGVPTLLDGGTATVTSSIIYDGGTATSSESQIINGGDSSDN